LYLLVEQMNKYILISAVFLMSVYACEENIGPPDNPFDEIDYTGGMQIEMPQPDSSSLIGLHTYIFSQSCAVPGCHDGSFEPDFRTVQSTYSSLVYQPVVKNDEQGNFSFRVIPGNYEESWLYFRVTTNNASIGRMPLYDNPLSDEKIEALKEWITNGAPDIFGNPFALPNTQPRLNALAAYNVTANGAEFRRDTARVDGNPVYPFIAARNFDLDIWLGIQEDSTALDALTNTHLLFSGTYDNFSNALSYSATYSASPKIVADYFGAGKDGLFYWKVRIPAGASLPEDENGISFFRFYTKDGDHVEEVEFPTNSQPLEFKLYMSLVRG